MENQKETVDKIEKILKEGGSVFTFKELAQQIHDALTPVVENVPLAASKVYNGNGANYNKEQDVFSQPIGKDSELVLEKDCNSSTIKHMSYSGKDKCLKITFNTDKVYEYYDVPAEIAKELYHADSTGSYFTKEIKSNYQFQKIS